MALTTTPTGIFDVIIPAFNEQENISLMLSKLPKSFFRHIIVVNNGSSDQTKTLALQAGVVVVDEPSRGYGAACLAGLAWVASQPKAPTAIGFIDADLADEPEKLPMLCDLILQNQADLVIGSRVRLAEANALTPVQRFGNWLSCFLIHICTRFRYRDLGPMRVVRTKALKQMAMRDRTWGWTVEMQYKAAAMKLKIVEVDVPYHPRHRGVSKISGSVMGSIKAGWKILTTIAILALTFRSKPMAA